MGKQVQLILGIIIALSVISGTIFGAVTYFATAEELQAVAEELGKDIFLTGQRLEVKILQDIADKKKSQIIDIEIKYGENCEQAPSDIKRRYKMLQEEIFRIDQKIQKIESQQGG